MKTYPLPSTDLQFSRLSYGCMQIGGKWDRSPLNSELRARAAELIDTAREGGITTFDHADIYCLGKSETLFGEVLHQRAGLREHITLVSKCGIRFDNDPNPGDPGRFDFSYEHIVRTVEGSLSRLQTDRLDLLLLHRPDPLVEPAEVARAFDDLQRSGKVRYFGVSNHTAAQIDLLKTAVTQPLVVNQVEVNILHADLISDGVMANQAGAPVTGVAGTLDYCRKHGILIQAWSPVAGGRLIDPPRNADARTKAAAALIAKYAKEKGTSREAIALAWLLRHPAPIQPIVGTTNTQRLRASLLADDVSLTREEWYALFIAGRGAPMP